MRQVVLAFRSLFRTPIVTTVAIVSLAFGIGANAAIYSMMDQLILRDVPTVPHPEGLVDLGAPPPKPGSTNCNDAGPCEVVFSYPMLKDLEQQQTVFTGIAAHSTFGANLVYKNQTENGQGLYVNGAYFQVLGVTPYLGRLLTPDDDKALAATPVAVLSYPYWERHLGADSSVIGTQITIRGVSFTIVGVTRPDFNGVTVTHRPYVFVPITMRAGIAPASRPIFENRSNYWVYLFARLKPGVTIEQARVSMNEKYHAIINDVEAPQQKNISDATLARFKAKPITLEPGRAGQSNMDREARPPLLMLLATTLIVLLIACANIANLLLARAADRTTELAVRLSLGATRWQLVRQLLVESLVLATIGGIVSVAVAKATLTLVTGFMPGEIAAQLTFVLQPSALVVTALLAIGTGLLFGIFPALHSTRLDLDAVLRAGSGKLSGARAASRFRTSLATAQIGLSMALLIVAGVFIRSLNKLSRADIGANIEHVTTFAVNPFLSGFTPDRSQALMQRIEEELAGLPGVTSASQASVALLAGNNWNNGVSVQGFAKGPDTDINSSYNEVGPNYFKTIGAALIAGREFSASDTRGAPPVAIVNEAFAKKFNLGKDAVGKFMGNGYTDTLNVQIVGLVKNLKYSQVKTPVPPVYYMPIRQDTSIGGATFYVRGTGDPAALFSSIKAMMARIDPTLPVTDLRTMPMQLEENLFVDRMMGTMSGLFAVLATLLASVGLYGVLAYSVAQRTREIGVRMALGADSNRVGAMVLRQVGRMAAIGAPVGIVLAVALARAAKSQLYEIEGTDPLVMIASVVLLTAVALSAALVPALRASRVHPMQALRYE